MEFVELIKTNPSRLVVIFGHGPNNVERYRWGIVGNVPLLTLIGYITRIQVDLINQLAEHHDCPESALVVVWDGKEFSWYIHKNIPTDSMVGMLEAIKSILVRGNTPPQTNILGPDGSPMRR